MDIVEKVAKAMFAKQPVDVWRAGGYFDYDQFKVFAQAALSAIEGETVEREAVLRIDDGEVAELVKQARAAMMHIECFYEAKDAEQRIKIILKALAAAESLSSRVGELERALRDALDMVVDGVRDGTYSVSEHKELLAVLSGQPQADR